MSEIIQTPWTMEQVDALNNFQRSGVMHGFTCGECRALLLATPSGWICSNDNYRQHWAHDFMADPETIQMLGGSGESE